MAANKFTHELGELKNKAAKEMTEELEELQGSKQVENVKNVALDIVPEDQVDRFNDLRTETIDLDEGYEKTIWFHIIRKFFSCVILPMIDIGTDLAAAFQHFKYQDYIYASLTLFFMYLPGLVMSLGIFILGLFRKDRGDPPSRKPITLERVARYAGLVLVLPFLYPFVHIFM